MPGRDIPITRKANLSDFRAKEREIGKHILRALIERKPQFKDYFGIHVDEKKDDVYSCREFQLQSHRIQNFLDTAVSSLGFCPIGNIHQMAYRIGQIHFYRGVNFGADNWLTFKKVTVEIVTQDGSNSESRFLDEARRNCHDEETRF
ncbi:unnamed protein product [Caenorhabditis sp. 36 PRJEB53466]|nr:unnamed protein product [Caenorhabditis sp. 36 PRJEB53466]